MAPCASPENKKEGLKDVNKCEYIISDESGRYTPPCFSVSVNRYGDNIRLRAAEENNIMNNEKGVEKRW
eukprot:CAMPEP_0201974910 /NCGR_PEP_ID=MMETSP0904-20121228/52156_1 /ASSEMBLY_ACC=CAM_ASM_000553 /TAXON_ID=420261 /ORGANISM="Thalassiosira antarctica, Strain CCMP982" /LENGTH=68 /DNA_ID=CAMNT_0048525543 /DNA_START=258 /DNA_END=461 /DNA_ORIENTATION=-